MRHPDGTTLGCGGSVRVLAGCLRNTDAVASAAHRLAGGRAIGVIPAGARWGVNMFGDTGGDSALRPYVEDHLGAGAIVAALARLGRSASSEAALAATAFRETDVAAALAGCSSGRELAAAGHARATWTWHLSWHLRAITLLRSQADMTDQP